MSNQLKVTKPSEVTIAKYNKVLSKFNCRMFNTILQEQRKTGACDIILLQSVLIKNKCIDNSTQKTILKQFDNLMSLTITIDYNNRFTKWYEDDVKSQRQVDVEKISVISKISSVNNLETGNKEICIKLNTDFITILKQEGLFQTTLSLKLLTELSKHSIRLFEVLTAYYGVSVFYKGDKTIRVITLSIQELKQLFGVEDLPYYKKTFRFVGELIKPSYLEISKLKTDPKEDIKLLYFGENLFETVKSGKNITHIRFLVKIPTKPSPGDRIWTDEEKKQLDKRDNLRKMKTSSAKLSQAGLQKEKILGEVEETVDGTEKIIKKRQAKTDQIIKLFIDN